jgi:putative transposase
MDRRDRHLANALPIIARRHPAWGYRLSCGYLRLRGWQVNPKRVYRVWQRIGLSLPAYRPKRKVRTGAKLDGLALRRNDVWARDFVHDRYHNTETLRCDNGREFLADALRQEIERRGILLANIEPGKPWQNGSNESFNGTFRKECLNAEIFASLMEARVVIEQWRRRYNDERPHSSQNYITPAMAFFGLTTMRKA